MHDTKSVRTHDGSAGILRVIVGTTALLALGACAAPPSRSPEAQPFFLEEVPEQVAAQAAPYQNLQAVRLNPEDGCYWYSHAGPVETTLLPLRTIDGRLICRPRENTLPVTG
ncbi:hypothetical protein [Paracoccus alkanivorans]|uniref:hypothetical protein n=1 Tax=Paracoccus alkanivorans TaxID=2116655 RepID=UPI001FB70860|nr:hypothetical protein [Paracoccus alkanivorans]